MIIYYQLGVSMSDKPLHSFTSHISGKNAKVSIYQNRVEWERS